MSKRRKGFPSEAKVKRGVRIVHGNKELTEKLGRLNLSSNIGGPPFKNTGFSSAGVILRTSWLMARVSPAGC